MNWRDFEEAKILRSTRTDTRPSDLEAPIADLAAANRALRGVVDELHQLNMTKRAARRAKVVMGWCEAIFPKRVASEEIGDAMELFERWRRDPTCRHVRAKIVVKVVSTLVVLTFNSIRFVMSSLTGKKAE